MPAVTIIGSCAPLTVPSADTGTACREVGKAFLGACCTNVWLFTKVHMQYDSWVNAVVTHMAEEFQA